MYVTEYQRLCEFLGGVIGVWPVSFSIANVVSQHVDNINHSETVRGGVC